GRGVAVGGAVAAPDVPAGHADAEVHPGCADPQAVLAAVAGRGDVLDGVEVSARVSHLLPPRSRVIGHNATHDLPVRPGSADAEEVHHEDEGLVRGDDPAGPLRSVAEVRRDRDAAPAAQPHACDALVPPVDDLPGSEAEPEGVATVPGGVELRL